jgi:hypothetical protein
LFALYPTSLAASDGLPCPVLHDVRLRFNDERFSKLDVVASGSTSGTDKARDGAQVASFAQASATWWVEGFDLLQTVEQVRLRIHQGPPRF